MKKILLTVALAIVAFSTSFAVEVSNIVCTPTASGWGVSVDKGTVLTYTFDIDMGTETIGDSIKLTTREWSSTSDAAGTTVDHWFLAATSHKGESTATGVTITVDTKDLALSSELTDNKSYFVNIFVQKADGSFYSKCPGSFKLMAPAVGEVISGSWELLGPDFLINKDAEHTFTAGDKINIDFTIDPGVYNGIDCTIKSMKVIMRIVDRKLWTVRGGGASLLPNTDTKILDKGMIDSTRATFTVPTLPTDLNEDEAYQMMILFTFSNGENPTNFDFQGFQYSVGETGETITGSLVSDDSSTGIKELSAENASIYTNNGFLFINSKEAKQISIYSISGSIAKTVDLVKGENTIKDLKKGFYIVGGNKIIIK